MRRTASSPRRLIPSSLDPTTQILLHTTDARVRQSPRHHHEQHRCRVNTQESTRSLALAVVSARIISAQLARPIAVSSPSSAKPALCGGTLVNICKSTGTSCPPASTSTIVFAERHQEQRWRDLFESAQPAWSRRFRSYLRQTCPAAVRSPKSERSPVPQNRATARTRREQ